MNSLDHKHLDNSIPFQHLPFRKKLSLIGEITSNSLPNIAGSLTVPFANIVNVYFLSKQGQDDLVAGFGLGSVYVGAIALALIVCFNQAGNVLMAQAFGAKNYKACGLYFQRSAVLLALLMPPLLVALFFSNSIITIFPMEEKLVNYVVKYTRIAIPSIIGSGIYDLLKAFITSQKVFYPIIYIQVFNLVSHWFWAKLFIDWMQLEIEGAAICRVIVECLSALILYLYIKLSKRFCLTWSAWTKECLDKDCLLSQVRFSIPVVAMSYISWIFFEVMAITAGTFGAQNVVAHVAVANTSSMSYNVSLGVAITMTSYTANAVGKQSINEAKSYFYAGMSIIVTYAVFMVTISLPLRDIWASFWTTEPDTQAYLADVVIIFCLSGLWVDAINNGQLALLRAIGYQKLASFMSFITLYGIGFPLVLVFILIFDLKVRGLWLAFGTANIIMAGWSLKNIVKIDWEKVISEAQERIKEEASNETEMKLIGNLQQPDPENNY